MWLDCCHSLETLEEYQPGTHSFWQYDALSCLRGETVKWVVSLAWGMLVSAYIPGELRVNARVLPEFYINKVLP